MPFTARAQIHVEGGRGGAGALSFRRERRIPRGGPDGGNGGRGGSVVLVADGETADLSRLRHAVHQKGQPGAPGEGARKHGRAGAELEVRVPPGTRVVRDDALIATLDEVGQRVEVARGGEGGVGNFAFRSSTHRAPRETVPGAPGDAAWITLELRLPVDVAIVGLPNAGKSALLRALTGAGGVVAPYPHSTVDPAFGPLEDDAGHLFLVADLPGLDATGAPRRDAHLEQLERARVVLHAVDAADPEPAQERIARARSTLGELIGPTTAVVIVATHADLAPGPHDWADHAVSGEEGAGVDALRARVLSLLGA